MPGNSTQANGAAEADHNDHHLTDKDVKQLATSDEEFQLMTWNVLGKIIG